MRVHVSVQQACPALSRADALLAARRFAVAWYPICRIPDSSLQAHFLTFHSLVPVPASATHLGAAASPPQQQQADAPGEPLMMPLIGIKWVNPQKEGWLDCQPPMQDQELAAPGPDLRDLLQRLQVGPTPRCCPGPRTCTVPPRGRTDSLCLLPLVSRQSPHALLHPPLIACAASMQATAERLAHGDLLKAAGPGGKLQPVRLTMSDYQYFASRQQSLDGVQF